MRRSSTKVIILLSYGVSITFFFLTPLSTTNITKWSNTLKQRVGKWPNCLSVFDHFVSLALKGVTRTLRMLVTVRKVKFTL